MNELKVIEAPGEVYEELVSASRGHSSLKITKQGNDHKKGDLVGIHGKKPGDVIVCKITEIKNNTTDKRRIILCLKKM